jgi:hypothetical protein
MDSTISGAKGNVHQRRAIPLVPLFGRQAFRYNERKNDDGGRFALTLSQIVGRRVTYRELTGKNEPSDESLS